jgi:hypothetical protein
MQGEKNLCADETINYKLFGLGPDSPNDTDAPHRLSEIRHVISTAQYADRLPAAAWDCFLELQRMAKENLDSLREEKHCETCTCELKERVPHGWDADKIRQFLKIPFMSITFISGGF